MKLTTCFFKTILVLGFVTLMYSCEEEEPDVILATEFLTSVNEHTVLDATKLYVVEGVVSVHATLVIPAGTIIKFKPSCRIDVHADGSVLAQGTALLPIVFTSYKDDIHGGDTNGDGTLSTPAPKDWIAVTNWGNDSKFTFCEFYFGGSSSSTLYIINSRATVTNCTFGFNYGGTLSSKTEGALCLTGADIESTINNNVFYGNSIPMTIDVNMSLDSTNIFHNPDEIAIGNKYNGIFVVHSGINNAVVWGENEVPYVINNIFGINTASSLTLRSDVVLKMVAGSRIDIHEGGVLNHNGAIITSVKDDSYLGDTNGDGNLTSPAVGDWIGIPMGYGNYMTGSNILYAAH
jgi:hypothetical protein